jgi:hypothetical protein
MHGGAADGRIEPPRLWRSCSVVGCTLAADLPRADRRISAVESVVLSHRCRAVTEETLFHFLVLAQNRCVTELSLPY